MRRSGREHVGGGVLATEHSGAAEVPGTSESKAGAVRVVDDLLGMLLPLAVAAANKREGNMGFIFSLLFFGLWVWSLVALDDVRRSQRETAATLARLVAQLDRLDRTSATDPAAVESTEPRST